MSSYEPHGSPSPDQPPGADPAGPNPPGAPPLSWQPADRPPSPPPGLSPYGPPASQSPYGPPASQSPYGPPAYGASPYGAPPSGAGPQTSSGAAVPPYPQYGGPRYPSGSPYGPVVYGYAEPESDKSFVATWLLSWFLGNLGIDRFYLGKTGTGILKLVTLGGCTVWSAIDLILVLVGQTKDRDGRPLAGYDANKKTAWIVTGIFLGLGLVYTVVLFVSGAVSSSTYGR